MCVRCAFVKNWTTQKILKSERSFGRHKFWAWCARMWYSNSVPSVCVICFYLHSVKWFHSRLPFLPRWLGSLFFLAKSNLCIHIFCDSQSHISRIRELKKCSIDENFQHTRYPTMSWIDMQNWCQFLILPCCAVLYVCFIIIHRCKIHHFVPNGRVGIRKIENVCAYIQNTRKSQMMKYFITVWDRQFVDPVFCRP